MDFLRAQREKRFQLLVTDPQPLKGLAAFWTAAAQAALIGSFMVLAIGALYFARSLLFPVLAAVIVGMTLSPLVKAAARRGVPTWLSAVTIGLAVLGVVSGAAMILASPMSEWIARAPEIGATIKEKFYVLDRPLAALRELQNSLMPGDPNALKVADAPTDVVAPVLLFVTPALSQIALFFGTLIFFLIGQAAFRAQLVSFCGERESKLRALRIINDIEGNLATYLAVVTVVNLAVGVYVAGISWLFGLPNPLILGLVAMILNYLPYVGPAVMVVVLFAVGLVSFPSLGQALLAPASLLAFVAIEGNFLTPVILGHALTLNPLTVFLAMAFWAWLWGPLGVFLAVPMSLIVTVVFTHVFPRDEAKLPE